MTKIFAHDADFDGKQVVSHDEVAKIPLDVKQVDTSGRLVVAKFGTVEFRQAEGTGRSPGQSIGIGREALAGGRGSSEGGNIAIGTQAMRAGVISSGVQSHNIAIGSSAAMGMKSGQYNVVIGPYAAMGVVGSTQSIIESNTVIGAMAMAVFNKTSHVNCSFNTAIGQGALRGDKLATANANRDANLDLYGNTVVGAGAMKKYQGGMHNTAVGNLSFADLQGGDRNTGIGVGAALRLHTGGHNTVLGAMALGHNFDGTDNVCVGSEAGAGIVRGQNNIFIGSDAGHVTDTSQHKLVSALGDPDKAWVWKVNWAGTGVPTSGESYAADASPPTTPSSPSPWPPTPGTGTSQAANATAFRMFNPGDLHNAVIVGNAATTTASDTITIGNDAVNQHGDYSIQLGVETKAFKLAIGSSGVGTAGQQLAVGAGGTVEWAAAGSSRRWKEGIVPLGSDDAAVKFSAIDAVEFRYKESFPNSILRGTRHVGFIAEDIAGAGMYVDSDDQGPTNFSDRDMLAVLWKVVKDQQQGMIALQSRIEELEKKA